MKLQAQNLISEPDIVHGFFTRENGVSSDVYASLNAGLGSDDARENVIENRKRMIEALDCDYPLVTCYQIHSPTVIDVDLPWDIDNAPRADALVTHKQGIALGVASADCGPVLLYEPDARIIGAAHSGWKGALSGVIDSLIAAIVKKGGQTKRIKAAIGPLIRQHNYEVGDEVRAKFLQQNQSNCEFFIPSNKAQHYMFDLAGYIALRLRKNGVEAIEDLDLCTYGDEKRFYSYRRMQHKKERDYGRHLAIIALRLSP